MPIRLILSLLVLMTFATAQSQSAPSKEASESRRTTGPFEVKLVPLEAYNQSDKAISRYGIDKQFHGALEATSTGEMLASGDPAGSAGAVAMEKVTGKLDGRSGSFVLQHIGVMEHGTPTYWKISVVPDSGTGELAGLSGTMTIIIENGKHSYVFDYSLPVKK